VSIWFPGDAALHRLDQHFVLPANLVEELHQPVRGLFLDVWPEEVVEIGKRFPNRDRYPGQQQQILSRGAVCDRKTLPSTVNA